VISKLRHRVSYHINRAPWNSSTLTDIIVQHTKYHILCKHYYVTWLTTWLLWDFWEVRSTSSLSNEVHYTCVVLGRCSRLTYWLYTHRQNTQKLQRNCKQITENLQRWQTADVQKLSTYMSATCTSCEWNVNKCQCQSLSTSRKFIHWQTINWTFYWVENVKTWISESAENLTKVEGDAEVHEKVAGKLWVGVHDGLQVVDGDLVQVTVWDRADGVQWLAGLARLVKVWFLHVLAKNIVLTYTSSIIYIIITGNLRLRGFSNYAKIVFLFLLIIWNAAVSFHHHKNLRLI